MYFQVISDPRNNWMLPVRKKIVLEYNVAIQPVGCSTNRFRRHIGKIVRSENYVHMRDQWLKVDKRIKLDMWAALMVCLKWMFKFTSGWI